ncbi:MAG TPA: GAF domain-containing protein, partial [Thermoanaerobaculia bacterium]
MLPELKSIEPRLKQILYGAVEHVQATKAALYLPATNDLSEKTYEIVTSYQFADLERRIVRATDDLVDRLAVKRAPFFVNGLGTDQRFSEMLFRQGTDRLLATPLFSRGRLIGFIDMRDKAGKRPFDSPDVAAASKIAEELLNYLGTQNLFGLAPIKLVEEVPQRVDSTGTLPNVMPRAAQAPAQSRGELSAAAMNAITAARDTMAKRQLAHVTGKRVLTDRDLEVVRLLLPAAIAIPGAVLACFSAIGHVNNPQSVVAIATVT